MASQFEEDLKKAQDFHGHVCSGIILGIRIARAGLDYLGIEDPTKNKDFLVYIETDRCLSDAIQSVTGCSLGKRRLKWVDYGKMAASFLDMNTQKGVRIVVKTHRNPPDDQDMIAFWNGFTDEELFRFQPISIDLRQEDLPGRPVRSAVCEICHENINDGREILKDGRILCKACANSAYYHIAE